MKKKQGIIITVALVLAGVATICLWPEKHVTERIENKAEEATEDIVDTTAARAIQQEAKIDGAFLSRLSPEDSVKYVESKDNYLQEVENSLAKDLTKQLVIDELCSLYQRLSEECDTTGLGRVVKLMTDDPVVRSWDSESEVDDTFMYFDKSKVLWREIKKLNADCAKNHGYEVPKILRPRGRRKDYRVEPKDACS